MKNTAYYLKGSLSGFRLNWKAFLQFEFTLKLAVIVFFVSISALLQRFIPWVTGYSYLTAENLSRFASNPVLILTFLLVVFLVAFTVLVDMTGVVHCMHLSFYGEKTSCMQATGYALLRAFDILRTKRERLLFLVVLLMCPLLAVGIAPAIYANLLFQDMVVDPLRKDRRLLVLVGVVFLAYLCLFAHLMYTVVIATLTRCSTREAVRGSVRMGKGRHGKDLTFFLLSEAFSYLLYGGFLGGAMLVAFLLERFLRPTHLVNSISTSVVLTITTVSMIFLASVSAPMGCLCISGLYYRHLVQSGEGVPPVSQGLKERRRLEKPIVRFFFWLVFLACFVFAGIYLFLAYKGRFNPNIEYLHTTEVTAHRGASKYYPENTMEAFLGAVEQGADWVELDIHMSKDGQLFVMHDNTLTRTCGKRGYCWNYTWEELSQLTPSRPFGKRFPEVRIPLLSEVLDFAIEYGVRLNIEIKPSRYEEGLEEKLVELLVEKDFVSQCVVTSQKYHAIELVKEFLPEVTTVYVMSYAYGNIDFLTAADAFSVNISSITNRLVKRVHNAGKPIYAWTINRRYEIEDMVDKGVDNVITDDVPKAKKIIGEKRTSGALHEYIRWLNKWFR